MAGVSVKYKGNTIAEMSEEGTKTLTTKGMYCEDNIVVEYTGGSTETETTVKRWDITVASGLPSSGAVMTLLTDPWLAENRTDSRLKVAVFSKFTNTENANMQFFLYKGNAPFKTANGTNYYSYALFNYNSGITPRYYTAPLSDPINDIGDMDVTSGGALRVVAYGNFPMGVGDYTVLAWIDR